jgi:hypothetical protein
MLKNAETMVKNAETHHKPTVVGTMKRETLVVGTINARDNTVLGVDDARPTFPDPATGAEPCSRH